MSRMARLGYRYFPGHHDERQCDFVSSRGLLKSCRHFRRPPASDTGRPPPVKGRSVREHDSVYVSTRALPAFAERILPRISRPFVLVSGDSDCGVNGRQIAPSVLQALLDNPYLEAWHAQNLTQTHPKQHHMPIGLDYHTLTGQGTHPWGRFQVPTAQERALIAAARAAPPPAERSPRGYCNWHFAQERGSRRQCLERIDRKAVFFEPAPVPRAQSWASNASMLFTISPTGGGTDCHRTWEALALGTIAVVDRSELSALFTGLPVIEVEDWGEVTADFLNARAEVMLQREYDFAPLFLGYWRRRTAGRPAPPLRMGLPEFVAGGVEKARQLYA